MIAIYSRLPQANDRLLPSAVTLAPGGMGGNVSAIFARLGGSCRFLGPFSSDDDGAELRKDLERDGVDTTWAGRNPGSGVRGLIMVDDDAERAIVGYYRPGMELLPRSAGQSNNTVLNRSDLKRQFVSEPIELPKEAFGGNVHGFYCPMNFASQVLHQVPESIPVFIDLEGVHLDILTSEQVQSALNRASVLFLNSGSLTRLTQYLQDAGIDQRVLQSDISLVETCGEDGCRIHTGNDVIHIPGHAVNAVDTTGAGDSFAASFIWKYLSGGSLEESGKFACHIAALSVQGHGSRPGVHSLQPRLTAHSLPTASEIER